MKKSIGQKAIALTAGVLSLLFVLYAFPQTALAAGDSIESLDIAVELQEDGGADITEVCKVNIATGTEYYLAFVNLDNQVISDFSVTDENGTVLADVGTWNSNQSREEKAGKSGLVKTSTGYEMCWGFGEYGQHTYTLRYHITNVVKGYPEADMMTQVFVPEGTNNAGSVRLTIEYAKEAFTSENTGIWAFGFGGSIQLEDGKIVVRSDGGVSSSQFVGVMAEFDKGMFSPADIRGRSVQDVKDQAFEGSDYRQATKTTSTKSWSVWQNFFGYGKQRLFVGAMFGLIVLVTGTSMIRSSKQNKRKKSDVRVMKPLYKTNNYSRELPFGGDVLATYKRLVDLPKNAGRDVIIGAYFLKWVRSGQVEIVFDPAQSGEGSCLRLLEARQDMPRMERELYAMCLAAASCDKMLQPKEFQRWSRKEYDKVSAWFTKCQDLGKQALQQKEVYVEEFVPLAGRMTLYQKTMMTPLGDKMTTEMFGFKKYLQDFTIINERQAREVELWDEYLVFAQLFGIADAVAKQFALLYPGYFYPADAATDRQRPVGIETVVQVSAVFGAAIYRGYTAGVRDNTSYSSDRSSGGGGRSSSGGGGGSSGSGSGGGMGSR